MLAKKPKGATEKRKSSSVSGLLWMFVGAVLTLMIGVFIYLSPLFNFSPADGSAENDPDRKYSHVWILIPTMAIMSSTIFCQIKRWQPSLMKISLILIMIK